MAKPKRNYIPFTADMKKDYTILVPNMLPRHFKLIIQVFSNYGYNLELLETSGPHIAEMGLKYVHNDTCYPAILVIGQFIDAINSGKYDPNKVALVLFQTGGGCRASNYIFLLRKALQKAGYGHIPVISLNFNGLEDHPGFKLTLPLIHRLFYAIMYGDILLSLVNQCKPYELNKGESELLADEITSELAQKMETDGISYRKFKRDCKEILKRFAAIPRQNADKVKVGVVGEIYVKYSPLGNNNLEQFLVDEGAEVVVPGLTDFMLYTVVSRITDCKLYGMNKWQYPVLNTVFKVLVRLQKSMIKIITDDANFTPPTPITHTIELIQEFMSLGTKMGEGWLLPAEMLELNDSGVHNIVCTQPFGCLPNHICGKGMMKPIKDRYPEINIVSIDYDPGATKVNQENRLKLMLSNARMNMERQNSIQKEDFLTDTQEASVSI